MLRRIAILLTNNDDAAFARAFEDDGRKVTRLLYGRRPQWQYEVLSAKDGVLPSSPHAHDAYVITGSPASVNDARLSWVPPLLEFIRSTQAAQRPVVGLCFGHQALALALGGQVRRHPGGWGLGLVPVDWRAPAPSWARPGAERTWLLAAHNEQVHVLPPGGQVLAGSDFCPVGAMRVGRYALGVQHHPEMSIPFMRALLDHLEGAGGLVDAATLAAARASLRHEHDGALLAQWICGFIEAAWQPQDDA